MRDSLARHGLRWRLNFLAGQPFYDEDGWVAGYYGAEPKWREEDLTPEDEAELTGWIAEHLAARPEDDPLWVRWATLENNGVEHYHRKGKPLIAERPARGYECLMCKGHIFNENPGDYPFYGGPADGRWIVTGGLPTFRVPIVPEITALAPDDGPASLSMSVATYYRYGDRYVLAA